MEFCFGGHFNAYEVKVLPKKTALLVPELHPQDTDSNEG
jgi:hypothetical protein